MTFGRGEVIFVAAGAFAAAVIWLSIKLTGTLIKRGWTDNQLTLCVVAFVAVLLGAGWVYSTWQQRSLQPEAVEYLSKTKLPHVEIVEPRVPGCARILDFGFIVRYELAGATHTGRLCRRAFGGDWIWYWDANNFGS